MPQNLNLDGALVRQFLRAEMLIRKASRQDALFAVELMDFLPWTTFTRDRRPVWRRSPASRTLSDMPAEHILGVPMLDGGEYPAPAVDLPGTACERHRVPAS